MGDWGLRARWAVAVGGHLEGWEGRVPGAECLAAECREGGAERGRTVSCSDVEENVGWGTRGWGRALGWKGARATRLPGG